MTPPLLESARLRLRGLVPADAPAIAALAGEPAIAATTIHIPHPYPHEAAARFIESQQELFETGLGVAYGIEEKADGCLCGCVGLGRDEEHHRAELGYWIGVHRWGRGYATEAARLVIAYGFAHFRLHRITARHFASNPASGRVLEKLGMQREGLLREYYFKEGRGFEDALLYGLLLRDWVRQAVR